MAEHSRFIRRMYYLMEECGMPDITPDKSLLRDLFYMIEEHCEMMGVELNEA